jgi:hypothetical protein
MPDASYYIVGDNDVWMIELKSGESAAGTCREEAVVLAIDAAQKLGTRGEYAHVCVLDEHGRFQSRWSYHRDNHLRRTPPNQLPDRRPKLAERAFAEPESPVTHWAGVRPPITRSTTACEGSFQAETIHSNRENKRRMSSI